LQRYISPRGGGSGSPTGFFIKRRDDAKKLFHIRLYSYPRLRDDIQLLLVVTKKLSAKGR